MSSSEHPTVHNIYPTMPTTNPLFMGFSSYPNVNKEIVCENIGYIQKSLKTLCFGGFLYISNLEKALFNILKCIESIARDRCFN